VSGTFIATFQEFRELFPHEALAPGIELRVDHVTILFTDLKDSTSLYERVGDDDAFSRVRDHFEILTRTIDRNRGAVIKTIGDAVMAAFMVPVDCVRAILEAQQEIRAYNVAHPDREPLVLKPGCHTGACLVVRLNDQLDYFGSTVNIAARVQGLASGGDMVLSASVATDAQVSTLLHSLPEHRHQARQVALKGLSSSFELHFYDVVPTA
jgi:class 3 adenylate cyclase